MHLLRKKYTVHTMSWLTFSWSNRKTANKHFYRLHCFTTFSYFLHFCPVKFSNHENLHGIEKLKLIRLHLLSKTLTCLSTKDKFFHSFAACFIKLLPKTELSKIKTKLSLITNITNMQLFRFQEEHNVSYFVVLSKLTFCV